MMHTGEKIIALLRQQLTASEFDEFTQIPPATSASWMSQHAIIVTKLRAVESHPNADRLDLAVVGDFRCVVGKDQYKAGDLVAYVPESSILPDAVLDRLGMRGSSLLGGADRNRVKAIRLRGALSQGVCYPVEPDWTEGQDVAELLGITKWAPPIPAHMAGEVVNVGSRYTVRYDIENVKWFPGLFRDGDAVVMTEKCHGTWLQAGVPPVDHVADALAEVGPVVVSSKGQADKGLAFKDSEANRHNLYLRAAQYHDVLGRVRAAQAGGHLPSDRMIFVLGEVLGVQDLKYGASTDKDDTIGFRIFDVRVGDAYLDDAALDRACAALGLPRVPVLYRGPFSEATLATYTSGRETVTGRATHVREGVVLRPTEERCDFTAYPTGRSLPGGRVQVKSISPDYLTRKGKDEDLTEFQ